MQGRSHNETHEIIEAVYCLLKRKGNHILQGQWKRGSYLGHIVSSSRWVTRERMGDPWDYATLGYRCESSRIPLKSSNW
jgi:hypothetical protein